MLPDPWEALRQAIDGGQKGDIRKAFEALYKSVRNEMVRYAQWCVRRHNSGLISGFLLDPSEIVDDAFSELYLKCERITGHPKGWLLGVIRRKLDFDVARAWEEEKLKPAAQQQLNGLNRRKTKTSIPKAQRLALREAINSLPDRMRTIVIALYYGEESIANMAKLLGITENAVVQTKHRALNKLKSLLV